MRKSKKRNYTNSIGIRHEFTFLPFTFHCFPHSPQSTYSSSVKGGNSGIDRVCVHGQPSHSDSALEVLLGIMWRYCQGHWAQRRCFPSRDDVPDPKHKGTYFQIDFSLMSMNLCWFNCTWSPRGLSSFTGKTWYLHGPISKSS